MENSEVLLEYAVSILSEAGIQEEQWAVGGGTVLKELYHHRLSKDIDIFIDDIQLLSSVSPKLNDNSSEALYYDEGSQFVSLTYNEGKVDFIASPSVTEFSPHRINFYGKDVYVEDPVEIVSKKLFYRGNFAVPRDIFDLAVVYDSNRKKDLISTLKGMPDKVEQFYKSIEKKVMMKEFVPYSKEYEMMILPKGKNYINKEVDICNELLRKINRKYKPELFMTVDA